MISVVACVKDRAESVKLWLESLSLQTRADLMEVVLVDYGSTDGIDKVLKSSPIGVNTFRVSLREDVMGFPEAFLKNVGIRRAHCDIIACTNVDLAYEPRFFENMATRCGPGVLVQAVRRDTKEGMEVTTDGVILKDSGDKASMVIDYLPDTGLPIVAGADCQMMSKQAWNMFQGYDEDLCGWGSLDSDLMMRALLWGMDLIIVGHRHSTYVHRHHPVNMEQNMADVNRNHDIIMSKRDCGSVRRNRPDWGAAPHGEAHDE
jgi:glycosyltransferase involved in cell wall biosynthesis